MIKIWLTSLMRIRVKTKGTINRMKVKEDKAQDNSKLNQTRHLKAEDSKTIKVWSRCSSWIFSRIITGEWWFKMLKATLTLRWWRLSKSIIELKESTTRGWCNNSSSKWVKFNTVACPKGTKAVIHRSNSKCLSSTNNSRWPFSSNRWISTINSLKLSNKQCRGSNGRTTKSTALVSTRRWWTYAI